MLYVFVEQDSVFVEETCVSDFVWLMERLGDVRIISTSHQNIRTKPVMEWIRYNNQRLKWFEEYNLKMFDTTPCLPTGDRVREIQTYIEMNDVKDYLIIDTGSRYFFLESKNVVLVNERRGFCEEDILKILEIKEEQLKNEEKKGYKSQKIACCIKPTERYFATGQLLIPKIQAYMKEMNNVEVPEKYLSLRKDKEIEIVVERENIVPLIEELDTYVKQLFPIGNILEMICFYTDKVKDREIIEKTIREYQ